MILFSVNLSAQSFDNDDICIILNDYGRVRVLSPETSGRQIDRLSLPVLPGAPMSLVTRMMLLK